MQFGNDIIFTAPGPDPIPDATTEIVGSLGSSLYVYWIVSHFPIGSVVSGPFPRPSAPDRLSDSNYVRISWLPSPGASSYDLLVTRDLKMPMRPGNFALATGLTSTSFRDEGDPVEFYDLTGVPLGAPQNEHIFFDNRDLKQPTLRFIPWPIEVSSIIFEDGTSQNTAGGGGGQNQTPWLSDIDGAGHSLLGADAIFLTGPGSFFPSTGEGFLFYYSGGGNIYCEDFASQTLTPLGINASLLTATLSEEIRVTIGDTDLLAFFANSDEVTIAEETIFADYDGHVGINTSNPRYALDVIGDVNITGVYRINGTPLSTGGAQTPWTSNIDAANFNLNNCAGIGIRQSTVSPSIAIICTSNLITDIFSMTQPAAFSFAGFTLANNNNNNLRVRVYGTSYTQPALSGLAEIAFNVPLTFSSVLGLGEWMRISALGNVGIRQPTPAYPLDITGDLNITGTYRVNGVPLATGGGAPGGADTQIQYNNAGAFGGSSALTFLNNFALLRLTPAATVAGGFQVTTNANAGQQIAVQNFNTGGTADIKFTGATSSNALIVGCGNTAPSRVNVNFIATLGFPLVIQVNNTLELMRFTGTSTSDARVGILTNNPQYSLDVVGDVNVTGVYRINGVPLAAGASGPTVMTRPGKIVGTIYQNTTGQPLYVVATVIMPIALPQAEVVVYCDANPSPSTEILRFQIAEQTSFPFYIPLSFIVLPGYYYLVVGSATTQEWTEWY